MTPESEMRVEMPHDCMKGKESFSFTAGAWFDFSVEHESIKISITVAQTETVMWVKRDNPVVDFTLLFSLLNLPFHEPSFVERNTDVETQVVFSN